MRREERQISDRAEIDAILTKTRVCRLAFAVAGEAYIVPLSHGYDPEMRALFFHTAEEGKKIECIEANPRVCFEVEGTVEVKAADTDACSWGVHFESVIGHGTLDEIVDPKAKISALRVMMKQQAGHEADWTFSVEAVDSVRVWRLDIDSMSGKRSFAPESV